MNKIIWIALILLVGVFAIGGMNGIGEVND